MKTNHEIKMLNELKKLGGTYYCNHNGSWDGRRISTVWLEINGEFYRGQAAVSDKDRFDRKKGRAIAMGRAMNHYQKGIKTTKPEFLIRDLDVAV